MTSLLPHRRALLATLALLLALLAIELAMGRPPICTCGTIKLWHGVVQSSENSQQISDWYSFSHVIHGLLFYWFAHLLWRKFLPAFRPGTAPAHSSSRPPNQDNALGGRVGEWAGAARGDGKAGPDKRMNRYALPIAVAFEGFWEVLENTPFIIDRYREVTISWGYSGDSILNSMADVGFMIGGFLLASRLPVWASVALALALELFTLVMIRDNLTLNVLMLLWPIPAIAKWQAMG